MIILFLHIIIIHDVNIKYYILIYLIDYIVTDFRIKHFNFQDKQIKITLIDANGDEFYRNTVRTFYKNANGFFLIYDVSNRDSFDGIKKWLDHINLNANEESKAIKILIGNKKDIDERVIEENEGKQFAYDNNMPYFETSAKTSENVEGVFKFLINKILRYKENILD